MPSATEVLHLQNDGLSSDGGTLSEQGTSNSATTAMTSAQGTDEEMDMAEDSVEELEDEEDTESVYLANQYPEMSSLYMTEMPYYAPDHDMAASTRSLWVQDLDYREIHGRLYCREWFMPIDDLEQLRGALNHQVFIHVLGGSHTVLSLDNPQHILDVGTGTGEWAIRMAEIHPRCEVVGIDIAAIAETSRVPMNVFFEIEDAEDWDRSPDMYDLIHFRSMEGAFTSWETIYSNVYTSLKPGGWIELQDFDTTVGLNKFIEQFSPDSPIHALFSQLDLAAKKSGRPRGNAHMDPRMFVAAGFVDVRVTDYTVPITIAEKSAGKIWLVSCLDALEALCLRLLTEQMGWDADECKAACEQAARELADLAKSSEKRKGLVVKIRVVVARKPVDAVPGSPLPPGRGRSGSIGGEE